LHIIDTIEKQRKLRELYYIFVDLKKMTLKFSSKTGEKTKKPDK